MSSILQRQSIEVVDRHDLVVFKRGHHEKVCSYNRALDISQNIRVIAKVAMYYDHEPHAQHRELAYDNERIQETLQKAQLIAVHTDIRSTEQDTEAWGRVTRDGAQVVLWIGTTGLGFHWRDALILSAWFRIAGKAAKRWAGDRSRRLRIVGILHDASSV